MVNPATLLDREQHLAEQWIFKDLVRRIATTEAAVEFCAERHALANTSDCQVCNRPRYIRKNAAKQDGIMWVCPRCGSKQSVRAGSFFVNSRLSLEQIILFTYSWSKDWLLKDCSVGSGGMATQTQTDWGNFVHEVCQADIERNRCVIGGHDLDANGASSPKVVEINESVLAKPRYKRGDVPREGWVFGGIERGSRKCFLVEVRDRSRA